MVSAYEIWYRPMRECGSLMQSVRRHLQLQTYLEYTRAYGIRLLGGAKMQLRRDHKQRRGNVILLVATASVTLAVLALLRFSAPAGSDRQEANFLLPRPASSVLGGLKEHDCYGSRQGWPVFANKVEGVRYPFFISLADLGTPDKPNRNFQRMIKGKLFQKPAISETVQGILGKIGLKDGVVVDVGANVGMAAFAAAAMGLNVLAFEPVVENLQKLCDGVYLNRAGHLVRLFHAAVSDTMGNITLHKVIGRLDNTAVSLSGAKLAFKSNQVIPFTVAMVTLDSLIPDDLPVVLLKIDVQGWEYHVLKGATRLLSRPGTRAPYVIFEEDEKLLQESNSTSSRILGLMERVGYTNCIKVGNDRHCMKQAS